MPEYKDISTRLREATKRTDLPVEIVSLLSQAYKEIEDYRIDRDDARMLYCEFVSSDNREGYVGCADTTPSDIAKQMGWHGLNFDENNVD